MNYDIRKSSVFIKSVITALTALVVNILVTIILTIASGYPLNWYTLNDGINPAILALVLGAVVGLIGNRYASGSNREPFWFTVTIFVAVIVGIIAWPLFFLFFFGGY